MRRTVEAARDRGVNLAFLGANAVYWRIRFARTPLGAGRLVVCGKDDAGDPGPACGARTEPESSLTGPMYDCFPAEAAYVVYDPGHWIFKGTGVRRGTAFPGMAGVETDKVILRRTPADGDPVDLPPQLRRQVHGRAQRLLHRAQRRRGVQLRHHALGVRVARRPLRSRRHRQGRGLRPQGHHEHPADLRHRPRRASPPGRGQPRIPGLDGRGMVGPGAGPSATSNRTARGPLDRERVPGAGRHGVAGAGSGSDRGPEPSDP